MSLFAFQPANPPGAADNPVSIQWWLLFGLLVAVLIAFDLFVIHRKGHEPSMRESAITVSVWFLLAVAFNAFVWWWRGSTAGVQFASGYLVEWSMSMDNVFVFAVIFRYFQVPKEHQYGVLFWGILGAVVMRLGFILAGTALIAKFSWVLPVFGIFSDLYGIPSRISRRTADRSLENARLQVGGPLAGEGRWRRR